MNLVAKEFVAARGDLGGTLILSEFAGAAQDLDGALIVNPYDIEAIKRALVAATDMPIVERAARMKTMRAAVKHNDVHRWASGTPSTGSSRPVLCGSVTSRFAPTDRTAQRPTPFGTCVSRRYQENEWTSRSSPRHGCRFLRPPTAERKQCSTNWPAG